MSELHKTTLVSILVLSESSMISLSSIIDPLRAANRLSRLPLFSWRIVSTDGQAIKLTCGIEIKADTALDAKLTGDLVFVLAGFNHERHVPKLKLSLIRKLAQRHKTVCAVEAGTWVLARAGVISDHRVTTHWEDLESFAFAYPKLNVVGERFVIDRNIWSSGGASPNLDMLLHYLRVTQHQSLALDVANVFIYNESKASTEVQKQASHGRLKLIEPRLAKALELMEQHIESPLALRDIGQRIGLCVRTLELLFGKHLGATPAAHYLRLRLQTANRLVRDSNSPMQDVAIRSGFNSQAAFNRAFKRRFGLTPGQVRRRVSAH